MKLKELTPKRLRCVVGACPAVFATADGKIVLIGKRVSIDGLAHRVGVDEEAVSIDQELLLDALKDQLK